MSFQALSPGLPFGQAQWAITELNSNNGGWGDALDFDTLLSFKISANADAPSEAVEQGAFVTYNKISSPREIIAQVARSASPDVLEVFLTQLEKWRTQALKVNFLTPEIEYPDLTLTSFGYARSRDIGEGLLIVDLTFREIREVARQYTTVSVPPIPPRQARNPADATPTDLGMIPAERKSENSSIMYGNRGKD